MTNIRQLNVLIIDDSKELNSLHEDWDGPLAEIQQSHIVIHRGRVLKNAYGSVFKDA